MMQSKEGTIKELLLKYIAYEGECPEGYERLCAEALKIVPNAYSFYSGFSVGAAVWLDNDKIITGTNQENIAYPSGICAERTALYYANSQYPDEKIKAIAIVAFDGKEQTEYFISPCGACRQVFAETIKRTGDFEVIMIGKKEIVKVWASDLLPFTFHMDD